MITILLGLIIWFLIGALELSLTYLIEKELTTADKMTSLAQILFLLPVSLIIALAILPVV